MTEVHEGSFPVHLTMTEAASYILQRLPAGVELHAQVNISRYPTQDRYNGKWRNEGGIFSYDFMTTAGRNIATWIPDMARPPMLHPGPDGQGRLYGVRPDDIDDISSVIERVRKSDRSS